VRSWIPIRLVILAIVLAGLAGVVAAGAIREAMTAGPGISRPGTVPQPRAGTTSLAGERPIAHYTPGSIQPQIGLADLCPHLSAEWDGARRSLTDRQKARTRALYGIGRGAIVAEWDHLVPRSLGGADNVSNIWPQLDPVADQRKDNLENDLHRAVCRGQLSLGVAQQRARTFWEWWE
jgi:hypothetical protein